jgi:hypothetical protein
MIFVLSGNTARFGTEAPPVGRTHYCCPEFEKQNQQSRG